MKTIIKINLGIFALFLSLGILFLPLVQVNAYFTADETSTFNPINLHLADKENGVESLKIKNDLAITDLSLYSSGTEVTVILDYYDTVKNENYNINSSGANESSNYGNDYKIDSTKPIKILNSKLEFPEDDDGAGGLFSAVDANDKIKLNISFTSAGKNIMKADPTTEIKANDQDVQFVKETVEKESKIDLSFLIPLVSSSNPSENRQVTATVKLINGNLIFNSGLNSAASNDNSGNTNSPQETATDSSKKPSAEAGITQGTGFAGHGVKIPRRDTFLGISTETNFENFISGVTNFILTFVAVIAVIMLVYGGYLWITDQGDEAGAEKAKKIIASSVIGILIIVSAYTIINTVIGLEGNTEPGCDINLGNLNELDCNFQNLDEIDLPLVGQGVGAVAGKSIGTVFGGDVGGIIGGLLGINAGNMVGGGVNNLVGGNNFFNGLFK